MAFKMQQDMNIKMGMSCEIQVKNSDVILIWLWAVFQMNISTTYTV